MRTGVVMLLESIEDLKESTRFELALSKFPRFLEADDSNHNAVNVMYILLLSGAVSSDKEAMDVAARECTTYLSAYTELLG
jgi:hypothetical protein